MIKQIIQALRTHGLMVEVERSIRKMIELAQGVFSASVHALLDQREVEFDLYARDREINLLVVEIRQKIVEHLNISACHNVGGELVLLKVINDLERVGDYSKNLLDLAKMLPAPLEDDFYLQQIRSCYDKVEGFFSKVLGALFDGDEDAAREVIEGHIAINISCEELVEKLMHDKQINAQPAIAYALIARYFKRVSSHLKNVASTAVNPFSHIGYMQTPEVGDSREK
ncbi:MAG TPA: PhoU domain-containing protein [Myxococcota bacterium]|nr:PhoU domain-containing protein [Myxococcota bacterium]